MAERIGFVAVYNLLREDYTDPNLEGLETAVNTAISQVDRGCRATPDNMIFSFPSDPSVQSRKIPIMVVLELFPGRGLLPSEGKRDEMAKLIKGAVETCLVGRGRDVTVLVRRTIGAVASA